ncbi:MAG: hypothetical protein H6618_07655 [Deltaproteobacteria bacterium]|nr:hypothetical protein [Deltaproteobacteria bacterium]
MKLNLINANELVWHSVSKRSEIEQAISQVNEDLVVYKNPELFQLSPWILPENGERYLVYARPKEIRSSLSQTQLKLIWFPEPINSNGWIGLDDEEPYWEVDGEEIPANRNLLNELKVITCRIVESECNKDKFLYCLEVLNVESIDDLCRVNAENSQNLSKLLKTGTDTHLSRFETSKLLVLFTGEMGYFDCIFFRKKDSGFRMIFSGQIGETSEKYTLEHSDYTDDEVRDL